MFGKREAKEDKITTILGGNSSFEGTLSDLHSLRVDGRFNGDISTEGEIFVGKMGYVKGNLTGKSVYVYGRVHGNLQAKERIEIIEGGVVEGDLHTKRLVIYEGAVFKGHSYMEEMVVQPMAEGARSAMVS